MRHEIHAEVLEDSVLGDSGIVITTLEVTFPRFILAEFNTHRQFSRNSASSRAIPPERLLEQVREHPFIPVFGSRVTGMGQGELDPGRQVLAQTGWLAARDNAVRSAQSLAALSCDKSHVNRLLEPFMWHTVIVTSRYWDHFFGLRIDSGAQPEFVELATKMQDAIKSSRPTYLQDGEWHLPLVTHQERRVFTPLEACDISAGRCARVSFDRHHDLEDPQDSLTRAAKLKTNGHLSPFEHQARRAALTDENSHGGNLGWGVMQYRKIIAYEDRFDLRPTKGV